MKETIKKDFTKLIPDKFKFLNDLSVIDNFETAKISCEYCKWLDLEIKKCGIGKIYTSMVLGSYKNIQILLLLDFIKKIEVR